MNKLIAVVSSIGLLTAGLSAQIDFGAPLQPSTSPGSFSNLIAAMASDGGSLQQSGTPNYTKLAFEYNFGGGGFPDTPGKFTPGGTPTGGYDVTLQFEKVANFSAFHVDGGVDFDIGFVAFEAAAENTLGIAQWPGLASQTEVFKYKRGNPDSPPLSYSFQNGPEADAFSFFAEVLYHSAPVGPHYQGNSDYWTIFQQTGAAEGAPALFILALEDNGVSDYDFDDGFFVMSGFITPVPEPSVIGLGGIVALIGFMAYRRRRSNSK